MSVITITAVGYSEVLPLSTVGRDFTMVLLAAGVTGIGVWFALITSLIVEFDLSDVRRRRRIMRSIEALNDHIVLCGGGDPGARSVGGAGFAFAEDFAAGSVDEEAGPAAAFTPALCCIFGFFRTFLRFSCCMDT